METLIIIMLGVNTAILVAVYVRLLRSKDFRELLDALRGEGERTRGAAREAAKEQREDQSAALKDINGTLSVSLTNMSMVQQAQLNAAGERMEALGKREEERMEAVSRRIADMSVRNEEKLDSVRRDLESGVKSLQSGNEAQLEKMRQTVDEKLTGTLEKRLAESFSLVSSRLEQVYAGLGEMRTLAGSVGDLKRVLSNVSTRGAWGEVQLGAILEQMLAPSQYVRNAAVKANSQERVEFAVIFPGGGEGEVLMPIDAKFPLDLYERVTAAADAADREAYEEAARTLEKQLELEAKKISTKYIVPPATTDFALMFLPVEGLYAEALRRPGLQERFQREYRVIITGPTTLSALLNSLRMGFQTLAIQKRGSEVWQLLGSVKTEFAKFSDILGKTEKKLQEASNTIAGAAQRSRAIERRLRSVEIEPQEGPAGLFDNILEDD